MKLFEAVPNLSEGRDQNFLQGLLAQLASIPNLWVLGLDSHWDSNRSVFTLVGTESGLTTGLALLFQEALSHIQMPLHRGSHPRIGAVDVCPIVPLGKSSLEEAKLLVLKLGEMLVQRFQLPLFFYQDSAIETERKNLSYLRMGGYEGLAQRMSNGFKPDLGPWQPHPTAGATIIGARTLMAAYNVNLEGASLAQAKEIARRMRSDRDIQFQENLEGSEILGWELEQEQRVQISCNLRDLEKAGPIEIFFEVKKHATRYGIRVTGSELVGLVPLSALVAKKAPTPKAQLEQVYEVSNLLGLSDFRPFEPQNKIIEFRLQSLGCPYEI